jgi:hypothetical protein
MKLMILLMSCNQPLYELEEQACMDTFLKNAEGENITYWFYKGLDEAHPTQFFDAEAHTLYLNARDTLGGTGRKTVEALKATLDQDYDYLLKTNVSTYLNIGNIMKAIETWEGKEDHNIYGGTFIVNEFSKDIPFPRGHITILSKTMVEGLTKYADILAGSTKMPKTDDTLIAMATLYYVERELDERYQEKLKEIPTIKAWGEDTPCDPVLNDVLAIRCKNEVDKETTPENMRKVHAALNKGEKRNVSWRKPADAYETGIGTMNYNNYLLIKKVLAVLKEMKEKNGNAAS